MFNYDMELFGAGLAVSISNLYQCLLTHSALYYYDEIRPILKWPQFNAQ